MASNIEHTRSHYKKFYSLATRWMDNDIYGHVNNVTYYSYFDTAVNRFLIEEGGLDIQQADVVGFVVASSCRYTSSLSYPDEIDVGLAVKKIGNSSVTYKLGIFKQEGLQVVAVGEFTHVFVNRRTQSSVPIPAAIRSALQSLLV